MKCVIKIFISFILPVLLFSCVPFASALEPEIPTDCYTYWDIGGMRKLQPARPMYTVSRVIYGYDLGLDSFSKPQNVFISETGDIYISDSGNGRLIILDAEMKLKEVMSEFTFEGQTLDVTGLAGVFIDSQNRLYIADPEHERVLICDGSGAVERILTLPESSLIPEDFRFIPTKVLADSGGTIYVISQGSFYGAIMYAPDFSFAGFFGSNRVRVRIQDIPEKIIEKLFSNNEKKGASLQALPYQFTGFCIDDRDFIYTSTGMISGWYVTPGQVKKMSPGGVNILKARVGTNMVGSDYIDFGDIGISVRENNMKRIQDFCDIDVDDNGLIYLLDKTYGRIFIYNNECVLLNAFGGGAENGKQKGTYAIASSIAVSRSGETIAVTDMNKNSLTIYLQTPYGELFNEANRLSMNGDYAKALPLWKTVVSEDRNNQLALRSIAQIFLAEKEYENALEYARASLDQDTYSQAFIVVRNKYMSRNAWWMTLILISVAACAVIAAIRTKKHGLVFAQNRKVRIMYSSILHPFDSFRAVKYSGGGSLTLATGVLVVYFILQVLLSLYSGFMYRVSNAGSYNMLFTLGSTVGLVLLWTIVNWAVGTLFEGNGRAKEIYVVICYSLLPQAAYSLLYLIGSHVLAPEESLVLSVALSVCTLASLFMLCVGTMTVHDFGFGKFIGITLLTLVGMFLVIFILFLVGILLQQFVVFLSTLYMEAMYR